MQSQPSTPYVLHAPWSIANLPLPGQLASEYITVLCSLKDMLYKRRMERQLAAARGEGPAPERAPDDVSNLCRAVYYAFDLAQPQCIPA